MPSDSITRVTNIFKDFFYSQPIFVTEIPTQDVLLTIENDGATDEKNKVVSFQGTIKLHPFFLQTKQNTFIVVGSTFSLYEVISREPYLEAKAEYQFQQQITRALGLTGGYVYYHPGSSNDFVTTTLNFDDVYSQDLSLRYEHDDQFSYLFILI